jgi:hypothetical protein
LHDAELQPITVDYGNKQVRLGLNLPKIAEYPSKRLSILFKDVLEVFIPFEEPWGSGYYIHSVSCEGAENKRSFITCFYLNSGDVIKITAERIQLENL